MLNIKYFLYSFALGIIAFGMTSNQQTYARNHHKNSPPPPVVEVPKDHHLNPRQSSDDISPFAKKAAENARQQQAELQQQDLKNKTAPQLFCPAGILNARKKLTVQKDGSTANANVVNMIWALICLFLKQQTQHKIKLEVFFAELCPFTSLITDFLW